MSTRQKVLEELERKKGMSISGEELAARLNVTRAAIWKAIQELKKEGYQIEAATNRGYCLDANTDILSAEGIKLYLPTSLKEISILVYDRLDSTNQAAKKAALEGAAHGTVFLAGEQTAGRGRMGRSFYSPPHCGIYMSFILRPELTAGEAGLLTTAAAIAVCRAIEKVTTRRAQIKWVNDILLEGKKICGILTEAAADLESGQLEYAVLGIGINYTVPPGGYPQTLTEKAGALFGKEAEGVGRNRLAAEVICQALQICSALKEREYLKEYRSRSAVIGRPVRLTGRNLEATAVDIGSEGQLVLEFPDGRREQLASGEIQIKGLY